MQRTFSIPLVLTLALTTVGVSSYPIAAQSLQPSSVTNQQLSSFETEAVQRANALMQQGDVNQAIAILEGVVAEGSKTPAIYQQLGDLYLQAGRSPQEAETAYQKAIQLATATNNSKAAAEAQVALAKVKLSLGQPNEAASLLRQAKKAYQTLGDSQAASEVDTQISAIANGNNNSGNFPRPVFREKPPGGGS